MTAHLILAVLAILSANPWRATAFVVPRPHHPGFPTATARTTTASTKAFVNSRTSSSSKTIRWMNASEKKNFVDEILDALDTMMGVSPLAETDLKVRDSANPSGDDNTSEMERLMQRAQEREEVAPPSDALQKPSVAIFFALLGIIPSLLFLSAVQNGFKPFGLN